jgi:hypothetical protein
MAELLREITGQADAAAQLGKGIALQPVAGLGGLGRVGIDLLRGNGPEAAMAAGGRTVDEISGWGGGPFTQRGAERLGQLGETVGGATEAVGSALGNPIERLSEVPKVGPALAAGAMGFVEAADPTKTIGKATRAAKTAERAVSKAKSTATLGYDPAELANRYPKTLPGELVTDKKTGKEFLQKVQSPEAKAVEAVRKAAQKEIDAGNYEPYFPVSERFYANPENYPKTGKTITDAVAKKAETIAKHKARFDTPDVRARLLRAYDEGAKDPLAKDWYAMGQLESEAIKHLGPEEGPKAFQSNFSQPMAATTGGADPTANMLMSYYGNYLRNNNLPMPQGAHEMPYPIGGRYASGNMEMYDKVLNQGRGLSAADQPKRHNFAGNFEGHREFPTIDEQMMQGVDPSLAAPPVGTYGVIEGVINDLAAERGVMPANFQDVTWKGLKGVPGKPMIQHVNEAIERTHRVTGKSKADIVRDSLIKGTHPLYGVGGAGVGTAAMVGALREKEDERAQ